MNAAERQDKIDSYGRAYETLIEALKEFPREMWKFRGEADPWTIHEIVVHITDSEANSYARCRKAIVEPGQRIMAYDENRWATALNYADQSADDAVELFRWLRGNTYKLIRSLPDDTWTNKMDHPENGTMSLDDWLNVYEDHIPAHVRQMHGIYEEWKAKN